MSLRRIVIAIDQLCNAIIGGYEDETISSRAWRNRNQWHWSTAQRVIDTIFFWDQDHCQGSYEYERQRLGTAPEHRVGASL